VALAVAAACAFVGLRVPAARACGPNLGVALLLGPGEVYLRGPFGDLAAELDAVAVPRLGELTPTGLRYSPRTATEVDQDELGALLGPGDPRVRAAAVFRAELAAWAAADPGRVRGWWEDTPVAPRGPAPEVPVGLPEDFAVYLQGARAWAMGDAARAEALWTPLAGREGPRRLWAQYMLARMHPEDPARFPRLRAEVAAGAPDPHGLAVASLGWEAWPKIGLDPAFALRRYVQQHAAGDPGARQSIRIVAGGLLADGAEPADLAAVAADPIAAGALTAAVLGTVEDPARVARWLDALVAAGGAAQPGADRLAWLAWLAGDVERAGAWAAAAPERPLGRWIAGRVALKEGRLDEAQALLDGVDFPDEARWTCAWHSRADYPEPAVEISPEAEARAEAGAVALARGDVEGALRLHAEGGHYLDFAYVADRIATADELLAFAGAGGFDRLPQPRQREAARAMLGRRLAREGRWAEATAWLPPPLAERARAYLAAGARRTVAGEVEAARILRHEGMELTGTELAPDFALFGGGYHFELGRPSGEDALLPVGEFELARLAASAIPDHPRRYHYRFRAAERMARAAGALPDQDPRASAILCEAGRWVMYLDPDWADPFYKGTVTRSWGSPLSNAADLLRWFPEGCRADDLPELPLAPDPPGCAVGGGAPLGIAPVAVLGLGLRRRRRRLGAAAALAGACGGSAPREPADGARYALALERVARAPAEAAAACAPVRDPGLRADCVIAGVERLAAADLPAAAALCAGLPAGVAQDECRFQLADRRGDPALCADAGRFRDDCRMHAWSRGVARTLEPGEVARAPELRAPAAAAGFADDDPRPWIAAFRHLLGGPPPLDRRPCAALAAPLDALCAEAGAMLHADRLAHARDTGALRCGGPAPAQVGVVDDAELLQRTEQAMAALCP